MARHHIPLDDLYACVQPRLAELQNPKDVHFKQPGYDLMGEQVAKSILESLKK